MPYENFRFYADQRALARGEARRDAQEPPEEHNCRLDGHDWHRLPGEAGDGTRFVKCRKCGREEEV